MSSLLLLPGDGRGPEMIGAVARTVEAAAGQVEIVTGDIGFVAYERYGEHLPHETLDLVGEHSVVVSGPVANRVEGDPSKNALNTLLEQMDFFARSRTFRTLDPDLGAPGVETTVWGSNVNAKIDVHETPAVDGITISKYIRSAFYTRMMAVALADVQASGGGRVLCLGRDDLFPDSSKMFYKAFDQVFEGAEGIETGHQNVRQWVSAAVRRPQDYRFLLVSDLYAKIAESVMSGITGGDHLSPTKYVADGKTLIIPGRREAVPLDPGELTGPVSSVTAAAVALESLGLRREAGDVIRALRGTVAAGERTPDLGGTLTFDGFVDAVLSRLRGLIYWTPR